MHRVVLGYNVHHIVGTSWGAVQSGSALPLPLLTISTGSHNIEVCPLVPDCQSAVSRASSQEYLVWES